MTAFAGTWSSVNATPPRRKWQQGLSRSAWPRQSSVGRLRRINFMSEGGSLFCSFVVVFLPHLFMQFNNHFWVKWFHGKKLGDDYLYISYLAYIVFILCYSLLFH
jgi:hypothetical protein